MNQILVMKNRRKTSGYQVKWQRVDKRGLPLFRTIECDSAQEAAAVATDTKYRLFNAMTQIVAPPEVSQHLALKDRG